MITIIGHGIDLVECGRIRELATGYGDRFLNRVFTKSELEYCLGRRRQWEHLSGRFAAKEAILKVLGTGWRGKIAWTDMTITNDPAGRPLVSLSGESKKIAEKIGIKKILLSITHTQNHAVATAVGLG